MKNDLSNSLRIKNFDKILKNEIKIELDKLSKEYTLRE